MTRRFVAVLSVVVVVLGVAVAGPARAGPRAASVQAAVGAGSPGWRAEVASGPVGVVGLSSLMFHVYPSPSGPNHRGALALIRSRPG